ncbi:purine and uridine phosphorylase [Aureobasidium pullulans]|uniref:Purine and uridine phosphorylase n=1 Tax=Aureobasidium pullulans TaxID=5580 RepID=A0A4S8ZU17_AURPU|nr:purine and uridine phosphorylase [Aureobasidium pullulans]
MAESSDPNKYVVGWICAVLTEYAAAELFLDETHPRPLVMSPNDPNHYTCGTMAGHNVVMAVLPDGEYGVGSAASVITNMLNSFPNLRIGLMVGIGGGAPTQQNDIRLGDVVVSSPKHGTGGVYSYDFGKAVQGLGFMQTGLLDQPSAIVRAAIPGLRRRYERDGHQIKQTIATTLDKWPRLKKRGYARPDTESDRLYMSHVVHPQDDVRGCSELCAKDPSNVSLDTLYNSHLHGTQQLSLQQMQDAFKITVSSSNDFFIVMDALDESSSPSEILAWLTGTRNAQYPEGVLEPAIRKWPVSSEVLILSQQSINEDIHTYIDGRVRTEEFEKWRSQPGLQKLVVAELTVKANGMFRWAACQLDVLKNCYNRPTIEKALKDLPKTLHDTYARMLKTILVSPHCREAITAIQFLLWSKGILHVDMIHDAILVRPEKRPAFDKADRYFDPLDVLKLCSSLVTVVACSQHHVENSHGYSNSINSVGFGIQLAHASVEEYLLSDSVISPFKEQLAENHARATIVRTCLGYLSSLREPSGVLGWVMADYPFAYHASRFWASHAGSIEDKDEETLQMILDFFQNEPESFETSFEIFCIKALDDLNRKRRSPLYFAAYEGLILSCKRLIDTTNDLAADGVLDDALVAASIRGHLDIVMLLLDNGASPNARGGGFVPGSALKLAAVHNQISVVQHLASRGADVDNPDDDGSALHDASYEGLLDMVKCLLDNGANVNFESGEFGSAVVAAMRGEREDIITLLLSRGADPEQYHRSPYRWKHLNPASKQVTSAG